jgi:glucose-1-phosphate adenylyltransferase
VERSILFPGVRVDRDAVVKDSIIMHDSRIGGHVILERCILDKQVWVGEESRLGTTVAPGASEKDLSLTVVGKDARIPSHATVHRGKTLRSGMTEEEFWSDVSSPAEATDE